MKQRSILLHICCAPCLIYPLRVLLDEGSSVSGLFYNPNIHPHSEYRRRLDTLVAYADRAGIAILHEKDDSIDAFFRQVVFREQDRCRHCYHLRLSRAAMVARQGGFDAFTTTLLYSRHQNHDLIRQIADDVSATYGIPFFYRDFREGWREGIRISKEMGMYRQPYCGCIFSERDRYAGTRNGEKKFAGKDTVCSI